MDASIEYTNAREKKRKTNGSKGTMKGNRTAYSTPATEDMQ